MQKDEGKPVWVGPKGMFFFGRVVCVFISQDHWSF